MQMGLGQRIGNRIKALRETRGLTQAQLADLMGKSVETISNFERGKVLTSLHTLERLARHLRVPIRDFFADDALPQDAQPLSPNQQKVYNSVSLLSEGDLDLLADFITLLQARQRRRAQE